MYLINNKIFPILFFVFILFLSSCSKQEVPDQSTFAIEDQISLGEKVKEVITSNTWDFPLVDINALPGAKQYITGRLNSALRSANVIHKENFEWELNLIQDDTKATAITLPGGIIYITTGLLKNNVANGAEFVSILAHEVSYADKDLVIEMLKAEYSSSLLLDVALGNNPQTAHEISRLLLTNPFSNEAVDKADIHGSQLVCDTDYDPSAFITFLERNVADAPSIGWLTTRPNNDFRVTNIQTNINNLNCPGANLEESDYDVFLSLLP